VGLPLKASNLFRMGNDLWGYGEQTFSTKNNKNIFDRVVKKKREKVR